MKNRFLAFRKRTVTIQPYATMLYDADVDVKTAQKLLGHADFGVTMKIYTHLSSEKETAGIEKLNEHLDQLLGSTIGDKVKEGQ